VALDIPQGSRQVCCNGEDFIVDDYISSYFRITPYVRKRCELWVVLERRNAQSAFDHIVAVVGEYFEEADLGPALIQGTICSLDRLHIPSRAEGTTSGRV
jgi:hypothetical protein